MYFVTYSPFVLITERNHSGIPSLSNLGRLIVKDSEMNHLSARNHVESGDPDSLIGNFFYNHPLWHTKEK